MKYGIIAHKESGRLPAAQKWCKDDDGQHIVFKHRSDAEALADRYNEGAKHWAVRTWYTVALYSSKWKMRHTPDWRLEHDGSLAMGGQVVASLDHLGPDNVGRAEKLANARLIVAAPKMLRMLVESLELRENGVADWDGWMKAASDLIARISR